MGTHQKFIVYDDNNELNIKQRGLFNTSHLFVIPNWINAQFKEDNAKILWNGQY